MSRTFFIMTTPNGNDKHDLGIMKRAPTNDGPLFEKRQMAFHARSGSEENPANGANDNAMEMLSQQHKEMYLGESNDKQNDTPSTDGESIIATPTSSTIGNTQFDKCVESLLRVT
jgi:hypothetical protein